MYEGEKGGTVVPITIQPGDNSIYSFIVTPNENLKYNTEYVIHCTTEIMAKNGEYLSSPISVYFTTEAENSGNNNPDTPDTPDNPSNPVNPSVPDDDDNGNTSDNDNPQQPSTPDDNYNTDEIYFSDVEGTWAEADINYLVEQNIVNGNPDGTFLPNAGITRAEAVAMLVRGFDIAESNSELPFADAVNHWGKSYIAAAFKAGIVKGTDATHFAPDARITREEFAAMVVRVGNLSLENKQPVVFTDAAKISAWAKESVDIAGANGIIGGYPDGSFAPQNNVTRAEACHMIVNLLKITAK